VECLFGLVKAYIGIDEFSKAKFLIEKLRSSSFSKRINTHVWTFWTWKYSGKYRRDFVTTKLQSNTSEMLTMILKIEKIFFWCSE